MLVTLLYLFLYLKADLNLLENRRRKFFLDILCASASDPLVFSCFFFFFYVIHFCFTGTKVHHNAEITTALVWLLRAVSVSVMPRCRDTYSGSSCANGQGWNGAASGPNVSWTEQHGFSDTQRHAVFSCLTGGSHPTLTTAVRWLHGGIQGILFFFLLESSLWGHCRVGSRPYPHHWCCVIPLLSDMALLMWKCKMCKLSSQTFILKRQQTHATWGTSSTSITAGNCIDQLCDEVDDPGIAVG